MDAYVSTEMHKAQVKFDLLAIGRRVREIRGFDLTQMEFARMLDIGQTQLSRYEIGRILPPTEVLS